MIRITEKDIQLLSFLKKYKVMHIRDGKKIYGKSDYSYKRLKQLENERFIMKIDWYKIKIDVKGTRLLREIGYEYNYICRRADYKSRIEEISKIAGLTLGTDISFIPSWELKDNMVFTDKGRKYIGELKYQNKKFIVYYISKNKRRVYISQIINDIDKAIDYKNTIVFVEDYKIINKSNQYFIYGKDIMLIINPKKENLDKMALFQNKDVYDIIEKVYKGKEILLSNWEKSDYMTDDRQYILFMPFLDTEKLHRLNIYYKNNKEINRKIDILTLKENIDKINEILTNKTNIIEIDSLLGGDNEEIEKS